MQKHRETSLKAQSAAAVAASVAALHHMLSVTCTHGEEESSDLLASGCMERPARAWKANKPVKIFIQLPGILQQAANGVDVLKVSYSHSPNIYVRMRMREGSSVECCFVA